MLIWYRQPGGELYKILLFGPGQLCATKIDGAPEQNCGTPQLIAVKLGWKPFEDDILYNYENKIWSIYLKNCDNG